MKKTEPKKTVRCAIYTRKSTEEGLDQEFNTLDAQREAAEAYITSQRHEGWICLPEHYDDGGFSGGNMERPALRALMRRVRAGEIDNVIVYKVDRLSRSLMDFTKIMEVLDNNKVSFVSVTQHFNTTNSMGRLTLNILLSFAQFEREIISERTRDKIAAARSKGKWIGGRLFLGYDLAPKGRNLVVNEAEADRVRNIFRLYLEIQSLSQTVEELNKRGWRMKQWINQKGKQTGGSKFTKSGLNGLLTNKSYIGKVSFQDKTIPAEFPGIVPEELFERVQQCLKSNCQNHGNERRNKHEALLRGVLRCGHCDCAMTHSIARRKGNRIYRYYVCNHALKAGWDKCAAPSLPAAEIEAFVIEEIKRIGKDPKLQAEVIYQHEYLRQGLLKEKKETNRILIAEAKQITTAIEKAAAREDASQLEILNQRQETNQDALLKVGIELDDIEHHTMNSDELKQKLEDFEQIWENLHLNDRVRLIRLLLEKVVYNAESEEIALTFRSTTIPTIEPNK